MVHNNLSPEMLCPQQIYVWTTFCRLTTLSMWFCIIYYVVTLYNFVFLLIFSSQNYFTADSRLPVHHVGETFKPNSFQAHKTQTAHSLKKCHKIQPTWITQCHLSTTVTQGVSLICFSPTFCHHLWQVMQTLIYGTQRVALVTCFKLSQTCNSELK